LHCNVWFPGFTNFAACLSCFQSFFFASCFSLVIVAIALAVKADNRCLFESSTSWCYMHVLTLSCRWNFVAPMQFARKFWFVFCLQFSPVLSALPVFWRDQGGGQRGQYIGDGRWATPNHLRFHGWRFHGLLQFILSKFSTKEQIHIGDQIH